MELFQFDDVELLPSEQIGTHSQESWELVLILKGSGQRIIENKTPQINVGELILIPPLITHEWRFDGNKKIANIAITFPQSTITGIMEFCPEISSELKNLNKLNVAIEYKGKVKQTIVRIIQDMRKLSDIDRLPRFIELLLLLNNISASGNVGNPKQKSTSDRKFDKFKIYCKCNYTKK